MWTHSSGEKTCQGTQDHAAQNRAPAGAGVKKGAKDQQRKENVIDVRIEPFGGDAHKQKRRHVDGKRRDKGPQVVGAQFARHEKGNNTDDAGKKERHVEKRALKGNAGIKQRPCLIKGEPKPKMDAFPDRRIDRLTDVIIIRHAAGLAVTDLPPVHKVLQQTHPIIGVDP
jgi:hypothetical protein